MANSEHLKILLNGVEMWNDWRRKNQGIELDLSTANLRGANLRKINFRGVNLEKANLEEANLEEGKLREANLSNANLTKANLCSANLFKSNLREANLSNAVLIEAYFVETDLRGVSFRGTNLRGVRINEKTQLDPKWYTVWEIVNRSAATRNLERVDLSEANLSVADLRGANLKDANLKNANLCGVQAIKTNFQNANLTGICIEDWNINSETKFDRIICEYIYLKSDQKERRPSDPNKIFAPGDFARLVQQYHATVDLIFSAGINWRAFVESFRRLQVETRSGKLSIQAIEKKRDGSFVVRVEVPEDADKEEIEKSFQAKYEMELKQIEAHYREKLDFKDEQIEFYKQQSTKMTDIVEVLANRPINVETIAMAEKQDFHAPVGSVNNQGTQTNVAVTNYGIQSGTVQSQDLIEAAKEIQALLKQLEASHLVSTTIEQMTVATEAIKKIENNSTLKQRAINAAKNGLIEGLKQNPVGAIVAGIIEGWTKEN